MPLRLHACLAVVSLSCTFLLPVFAQETPAVAKDETGQQLAALREAVIQQTRQIDLLTSEVARINQVLRSKRGSAESLGNTRNISEPTVAAPLATPSALPAGEATAAAGPETGSPAVAPAAPTGPEHIVAKGETLAVIAKRYNTTVEALEKLNNITDPKKLQVDQVLKLPATPSPTATP